MVINFQWVPGYFECIQQFYDTDQIESAYAELDIARLLKIYNYPFKFNIVTHKKGESFDLLITYPNGIEVCGETKCKLEQTAFTETTLFDALEHARRRNLPRDRPGIIFVKLPQRWIEDEVGHHRVVGVTTKFLKNTGRIVSVKYYTSFIGEMPEFVPLTGETLGWYEIPNPQNRFDASADWQLFPGVSDVVKTWNGRPPHWKPILKGYPI